MEKPGRNDPCYCGSGKKYKQCHMVSDMAAEREQRAQNDAARSLRTELLEFAEADRFDDAVAVALPLYWNEFYTAANAHHMDYHESARFYDWFLFDYVMEDGQRPVDLFAKEEGPDLKPAERTLLEIWKAADPLSVYELTGYDGQTLHLRDWLSGQEFDLFEPSGHGNVPVGALIIGRPVPVNDRMEFSTLVAFISPDEITDLRETLDAAREADLAEHPGATMAETMRRKNVLIIHHALSEAEKAGRPPVARLEPHHATDTFQQRQTHERQKVKGPSGINESQQALPQTRKKAI